MRRAPASGIAVVTAVAVASLVLAGRGSAVEPSAIAIAVAPFERDAPPDSAVPDVARLLADRMATQGAKKVVGPGELGVAADAEPDEETVRGWATKAGVAAVVVGRVTRIGSQVSIDVRLRSGETGVPAGTYVAEVARSDALEASVERLAQQILEAAGEMLGSKAPAVSAASPAAPKPAGGAPFGILFDSDRPISIRSDELEAVKAGGARRLLFTKNVVVTQDDVTIRSNRLEAFYPPNTSQPDRLVASGRVRMVQGENEARCDDATYERAEDMLICRGNAELREGPDCVAGNWIEFDLAAETVKVGGGATVVFGGENGAAGAPQGLCR